jgi:hypothetical protein
LKNTIGWTTAGKKSQNNGPGRVVVLVAVRERVEEEGPMTNHNLEKRPRIMTPIEFLQLSLPQREQLMWTEGVYLLSKYQERYALHLYSLYDFMIEVWYEVNKDKIRQITPVLDQQKLDSYLKDLSLKDLS